MIEHRMYERPPATAAWRPALFLTALLALVTALPAASLPASPVPAASAPTPSAPTPSAALQPGGEERPEAAHIRRHYSKYEVRIPMRDGVELFTSIYTPNDISRVYPILMIRTPYSVGPYGADRYRTRLGPGPGYAAEGYIFVYQDVRGRYMSEGEFVNMRPHRPDKDGPEDIDESTDTYDTIEWLLANVQGHNGRVGLWGISYPGFYASAGMIDSHPALKAVSPQAPIADWFWDDMHHHGAFILPLAFRFFSGFGKVRPEPTTERAEGFEFPTPDGYRFYLDLGPLSNVNERHFKGEIPFWNDIIAHPNYDEFWQARNILPHLDDITAAVLVVGGWYDTEDLYGPLSTYRSVEEKNPGIFNALVMGPWPHGGWSRGGGDSLGEADFGFKTSLDFQESVQEPFFRHFLKGEGTLSLPEALVFETGANRWRRFPDWPPPDRVERSLYLQPEGGLAFTPPPSPDEYVREKHPDEAVLWVEPAGYDQYISDPDKPVPYTQEITNRWARRYMTEDQRFAARRPDVLVYESEVLEEDLTLAGPVEAELWVATSGGDSDFVVKIIDRFPDSLPVVDGEEGSEEDLGGTQRLVRAEVIRGRFRESYSEPKPFVAGEVTRVAFRLHDFVHTFKRGHRVMVQIQSTWFPFVDLNPGKWVPNIFEAEEDDFIPVTNRIYYTPEHPSRLRVGVLEDSRQER